MNTSHTPGPWVWAEKYHGLYGAGPENAVLDWFPYEGMHLISNADANASLIAAAPDLLEVAQFTLEYYECGLRELTPEQIQKIRAAIAKATGAA